MSGRVLSGRGEVARRTERGIRMSRAGYHDTIAVILRRGCSDGKEEMWEARRRGMAKARLPPAEKPDRAICAGSIP